MCKKEILGIVGGVILMCAALGAFIGEISNYVLNERSSDSDNKSSITVVSPKHGTLENPLRLKDFKTYEYEGHLFMYDQVRITHHPSCPCLKNPNLPEFISAGNKRDKS